MISPDDVELLHVTDDPAEAVRIVVESYDERTRCARRPSRRRPTRSSR